MWGQKLGFVLSSSLSYPFKHFAKIKGLFFMTALVMAIILVVTAVLAGDAFINIGQMYQMPAHQRDFSGMGVGVVLIFTFAGIFSWFAFAPFLVGIIRSVVIDETADSSVITVMFKHRQLSYVWVGLKILLLLMLFLLPLFLFMFISNAALGMSMSMAGDHMGGGALGAMGAVVVLVSLLSVIAMIIVMPRWSMALVTAALDKGTSLSNSWNLTRGYWFMIVLSYFVVSIVQNVVIWAVGLIGTLFLVPLGLLLGPVIALPLGVIVYALLLMITQIPSYALTGYLYLVITDQVKFGEEEVKRVEVASA